MEISFLNKDFKDICEKEKIAKKKIGNLSAKKLKIRLADLMAANTVTEIVAGNPHPLKGNRLGEFSLRLDGGMRLVFISDMDWKLKIASEWNRVSKIKIIFIGDYHD